MNLNPIKTPVIVKRVDVENAEKFFNRSGKDVKDIYTDIDPDIEKVNENGVQNIFLYIPGRLCDFHEVFLN